MSRAGQRFTLYGDARSGNCFKAALILRLNGMDFDWVETDVVARETRTEAFLAINPNGRVPVLILPDGRILSESNAILVYLAEDTPWLPSDAFERAQVLQWLFFEQYSHEPYIAVARFVVCFSGKAEEQQERLEYLRQQGNAALGVMEKRLEEAPFLVADRFTIADIALYAYTHTAEDGGFKLDSYPAVQAWLERVERQPGFIPMAEACR
ncbi:MAG: glutathione S-transferase family protein [Xanthomonadales bacterium]|nr:glutathione S-transferase family protein [Xanthomonadales bacterium]